MDTNGTHRPWFRFGLTMVALLIYGGTIGVLVYEEPTLTVATAALIGSLMTGLSTVLTLAFKWFFDRMDTDESQDSISVSSKKPQKDFPDDY